jgi:hypothetical protein
LEIRPTKLVKGQGLARILTERNEKALNLDKEDGPEMALAVLEAIE